MVVWFSFAKRLPCGNGAGFPLFNAKFKQWAPVVSDATIATSSHSTSRIPEAIPEDIDGMKAVKTRTH